MPKLGLNINYSIYGVRSRNSWEKRVKSNYYDRLDYVTVTDLDNNILLECHKFDGKLKRLIKKMGRDNLIIKWLDYAKGEFDE